jgi:hypothetical protein
MGKAMRLDLASSRLGALVLALLPLVAGCAGTVNAVPMPQSSSTAPPTAPPTSIQLNPTSLNLTGKGSADAEPFTASLSGFTGKFSQSNTCKGIASVAASSNGNGKASYLVTPLHDGSCQAKISGGGQSAALPISVGSFKPVVVNPTSLAFGATGSKNAKTASVTQAEYAGSFTELDNCAKIATVAEVTNTGGKASFKVTPLAAGKCIAQFTGGGGKSATLPIAITLPGAVVVNPGLFDFSATGSKYAKTTNVTQSNYDGAFTESDTCAKIASVAQTSNAGGKAAYRVTPLGSGKCVAQFAGVGSTPGSLLIDVAPPGPVVVSPDSLAFSAAGSKNAKKVTVSQTNFADAFTESDTCTNIAGIEATSNAGGKAVFRVVPLETGKCSATFTGAADLHSAVSITVTIPGPVAVSPGALEFAGTGTAYAQKINVSQKNFSGSFTGSNTCSGIATIVASSNGGGKAVYVVTPVAVGSCKASFKGQGSSGDLPMTVDVSANVVVVPHSLHFSAKGSQIIDVEQKGYEGAFTELDDCTGTATLTQLSNAGGKASYRVTALATGSCVAVFTGGAGKSAEVPIDVDFPGGVVVNPAPLDFGATGPAEAVTQGVTQEKHSGKFVESDTCPYNAEITYLGRVSGVESYKIEPIAAGICDVTYTGANHESFQSHVTITTFSFGVSNLSRNANVIGMYANGIQVGQLAITPTSDPHCTGNGTTTVIVCTGLGVGLAPPLAPGKYDVFFEAKHGSTVLSTSATTPLVVTVGTNNDLGTQTLESILASFSLHVALSSGGLVPNVPASGAVTVVGHDPSGAAILGGSYTGADGVLTPIVVNSDLTSPFESAMNFILDGRVAAPSVTVERPSQSVAYKYDGLIHPAFDVLATSGALTAGYAVGPGKGTISLALECASSGDSCIPDPPDILFTAIGNTARITPNEPGWTNAPYNHLLTFTADTCNIADDPGAGGNWATFSPPVGSAAAAYAATAANSGATGNPAVCNGTISDPLGDAATFGLSVTISNIGVGAKR